jgi:glutamate synthase (NADPH/NADH) small chain
MDYLPMQNRICEGDAKPDNLISAEGKDVIIIGGGDTGADCLGTVNRQGAKSVYQLEILPKPPNIRAEDNPWPEWPRIFRTASAHEEGVDRVYSVSTKKFINDDNGNVRALQVAKVELKNQNGRITFEEIKGGTQELPCDLVLLAMGFTGPEKTGMLQQIGVDLDSRGNVLTDKKTWMTNVEGIFSAGDMRRGQSLIVWAIAEGRSAAAGIDKYLMGRTDLPALV